GPPGFGRVPSDQAGRCDEHQYLRRQRLPRRIDAEDIDPRERDGVERQLAGLLQRRDPFSDEDYGERDHDGRADGKELPERQPDAQPEYRPRDPDDQYGADDEAAEHGLRGFRRARLRPKRLKEQHGLEHLTVRGDERDPGERP